MRGDFREGAIAVVSKELVATERGDVQIGTAVVVVVADGGSHSVLGRPDAARLGDVGKSHGPCSVGVNLEVGSVQTASKGFVAGLGGTLVRPEWLTLNQKDIEIAVVVVVEESHARRHDLGIVELTGHAVDVHEIEAGFSGNVGEPRRLTSLGPVHRSGVPIGSAGHQDLTRTDQRRHTEAQFHSLSVSLFLRVPSGSVDLTGLSRHRASRCFGAHRDEACAFISS